MKTASIRRLPPELARKIAAGEVIERPASVVRELIENSVDSGAGAVSVSISSGGIESIRVSDDGCGIGRSDMDVIALPHTTSKIAAEDDLLCIKTLGFRGEALSSMAAVADLEILSAVEGAAASKYSSRPGRRPAIEPSQGKKGTSVSVDKLFDSFPARKRFLKRPSTETTLVVQTFIDRALPHPSVDFRLTVDSKPRLLLPASSQKARVLAAYSFDEPESLYFEARGKSSDFSYSMVFGGEGIKRPDRRHIQCFVNGRRVQDFSLQKAVEIGFSGFLPGGVYPVAFLFIKLEPQAVDFNIHPAKKEVRFRDPAQIQSGIIRAVRSALSESHSARPDRPLDASSDSGLNFSASEGVSAYSGKPGFSPHSFSEARMQGPFGHPAPDLAELRALAESRPALVPDGEAQSFKLLGQCLGVFILFEISGELFVLDQHAAHERMIFDSLQAKRPARQELLVPYVFETDSAAEDDFLRSHSEELRDAGYVFEESGERTWSLVAHPEGVKAALQDTIDEILSLRNAADLRRGLNATTACRSAIKDGDRLAESGMRELVERALELPEPRCPHGRPIWTRLSREELYKRVMRIV
jgi:DNA mismatch repair protein MutL